ncbi:MAG: hypothetical protein M1436_02450, partial [Acidobacteria bacterium]|nr:hypothetical protein [Acidobacteriota bacterium]
MSLFDIKVLSSTRQPPYFGMPIKLPPVLPEATEGDPISVPLPPVGQQFMKGFDIETWMFDYLGWTRKNPRPPLSQYPAFQQLVASLHTYHANYVNLWPARNVGGPSHGSGTYENDVLWPSQYDKYPIP